MLKVKRKRTCPHCSEKFRPINTFQTFCFKNECITEHNRVTKEKANRRDLKDFRAKDTPMLRKDVQKIANRLGKLYNMINGHNECVTCGGYSSKQMDGGHCYPTSTYSPIRYYTLQIRPQCVPCNRYNGGMPKEYRIYLIGELGLKKVEWLESHKGQITKKFTASYLQKYKKVMGKRLKKQEEKLNSIIKSYISDKWTCRKS